MLFFILLERALRCFNINIDLRCHLVFLLALCFESNGCLRIRCFPQSSYIRYDHAAHISTYSSSHFLSAAVEKIGSSFACLHADSSSLGLLTSESCRKKNTQKNNFSYWNTIKQWNASLLALLTEHRVATSRLGFAQCQAPSGTDFLQEIQAHLCNCSLWIPRWDCCAVSLFLSPIWFTKLWPTRKALM